MSFSNSCSYTNWRLICLILLKKKKLALKYSFWSDIFYFFLFHQTLELVVWFPKEVMVKYFCVNIIGQWSRNCLHVYVLWFSFLLRPHFLREQNLTLFIFKLFLTLLILTYRHCHWLISGSYHRYQSHLFQNKVITLGFESKDLEISPTPNWSPRGNCKMLA